MSGYFICGVIRMLEKSAPVSRRQVLLGVSGGAAAMALHGLFPSISHSAEQVNAPFPIRECYCPAHFGNSYEAMWPREMEAYLAELKWWGFNRYSDWITTTDIRSPYTSDA